MSRLGALTRSAPMRRRITPPPPRRSRLRRPRSASGSVSVKAVKPRWLTTSSWPSISAASSAAIASPRPEPEAVSPV